MSHIQDHPLGGKMAKYVLHQAEAIFGDPLLTDDGRPSDRYVVVDKDTRNEPGKTPGNSSENVISPTKEDLEEWDIVSYPGHQLTGFDRLRAVHNKQNPHGSLVINTVLRGSAKKQSAPKADHPDTPYHIAWADCGKGFEHRSECNHGHDTCSTDHLKCPRVQQLRKTVDTYPRHVPALSPVTDDEETPRAGAHVKWADHHHGHGFEHHSDCAHGAEACSKDRRACPRAAKIAQGAQEAYTGRCSGGTK